MGCARTSGHLSILFVGKGIDICSINLMQNVMCSDVLGTKKRRSVKLKQRPAPPAQTRCALYTNVWQRTAENGTAMPVWFLFFVFRLLFTWNEYCYFDQFVPWIWSLLWAPCFMWRVDEQRCGLELQFPWKVVELLWRRARTADPISRFSVYFMHFVERTFRNLQCNTSVLTTCSTRFGFTLLWRKVVTVS
jgi:hypothetical protein